jgi:hypothetical protein
VRDVDFLALLIGPPKHGKSSLAADIAEQRLRQGRVVLAQDLYGDFKRLARTYKGEADYLRALADAKGAAAPAGAAFPMAADRVVALAMQLGERWNGSADNIARPICVVVNETTTFEESGATHVSRGLAEAFAQRRHLGLEFVLCMQHAAQLPELIFEAATEVHMFRQSRRKRIAKLEDALGVEDLDGLIALPPHRYVTWRPVEGIVAS